MDFSGNFVCKLPPNLTQAEIVVNRTRLIYATLSAIRNQEYAITDMAAINNDLPSENVAQAVAIITTRLSEVSNGEKNI